MNKVVVIAEAGVNHNGSVSIAKKMILAAKKAGADYIKFQTGIPENIISQYAEMADYQKANMGINENQLEMVRKISLKFDDFKCLKSYCDSLDIKFMSTPFDIPSIKFLSDLHMDYMKVPSGEITNYPYLVKIAKACLPVIMSTGMSKIGEIEAAIDLLEKNGLKRDKIILLHCNTEYPTPYEDVNLNAMKTIGNTFGVKYGYSDHTKGIEVPIAAVAMGASIIEKHFTLDRNMEGPDHVASLEPNELKQMVNNIRNIEKALGSSTKKVTNSEGKNILIARKSIIAARNIKQGENLTEENLTTKRPGNGISPMRWPEIIGRKAIRDFREDELIEI